MWGQVLESIYATCETLDPTIPLICITSSLQPPPQDLSSRPRARLPPPSEIPISCLASPSSFPARRQPPLSSHSPRATRRRCSLHAVVLHRIHYSSQCKPPYAATSLPFHCRILPASTRSSLRPLHPRVIATTSSEVPSPSSLPHRLRRLPSDRKSVV